ncbi:MAG: hypothetical protein ACRD3F_08865 [Acidobacteriaceae bacterium]
MGINTIGIDLGKTVSHVVGSDAEVEIVVRKKVSRNQLLHSTSNLKARRIRNGPAKAPTFWVVRSVNRVMTCT